MPRGILGVLQPFKGGLAAADAAAAPVGDPRRRRQNAAIIGVYQAPDADRPDGNMLRLKADSERAVDTFVVRVARSGRLFMLEGPDGVAGCPA